MVQGSYQLGFADFTGNRQMPTIGKLHGDYHVARMKTIGTRVYSTPASILTSRTGFASYVKLRRKVEHLSLIEVVVQKGSLRNLPLRIR
jgi:hypothetical protein